VSKRLNKALDQFAKGTVVINDTRMTAQIALSVASYRPHPSITTQTPVQGSPLTCYFLGRYENMFWQIDVERPIPSWKALECLVEDYGQSVVETKEHDRRYNTISQGWLDEPPPAIRTNGHFCDCERRYKWNPSGLIDSVEYNWPKILGQFDTPCHYADAYR